MIYGCLQPRELWLIDFNHVQCTRFLCEDMAYEGVLQRPALLLAQFVERPALGGCEEVRLQFSGVDQHSITLEPHLLQQVKLRGRRGDRGLITCIIVRRGLHLYIGRRIN